ncbi:pyridoxamine 5'-phosphate oxidase family protein [Thioclava sp. BHET1]|nr:pyridoxamine 5'-phosphate oxidase family protein [Thioclava sp. BHET1]
MGKQFDALSEDHIAFIGAQHLFFTGSAGPEGRVNISPKGMDSLRILGPNRILWLNLTGSGNETAAHLAENPRLTLMWASFTTRPMILRTYGTARITHHGEPGWGDLAAHFPALPGARQIYDVSVEMVQTSCGYAVPFMEFREDRPVLANWAEKQGPEGLADYWANRNAQSIDGKPTGIERALEDRA